jgi:hypothetical protein
MRWRVSHLRAAASAVLSKPCLREPSAPEAFGFHDGLSKRDLPSERDSAQHGLARSLAVGLKQIRAQQVIPADGPAEHQR